MNDDPGFDPMKSPDYRKTVAENALYYCSLKGDPEGMRLIRERAEAMLAEATAAIEARQDACVTSTR